MQGQLGEMHQASIDTARLATAAKKQADIAERSLSGLERPYVFLEDLTISRQNPLPTLPMVSGVFKNYGRSPAIITAYSWKNTIAGMNFRPELANALLIQDGEVIAPGKSSNIIEFPSATVYNKSDISINGMILERLFVALAT